jgi:hypothetical protein
MTWILVFWLSVPENYTIYERYDSEARCKNAAQVWNNRLQSVKSKLISECRNQ